jgi:hypothetical protein
MPSGKITQQELKTFDPSAFDACQKAAWMDKNCMIQWVTLVLKEYLRVNPPPPGILLVLILDPRRCHKAALVNDQIQKLGTKVIHIPGRCKGLCQPLDVGINKPFKCRVWVR